MRHKREGGGRERERKCSTLIVPRQGESERQKRKEGRRVDGRKRKEGRRVDGRERKRESTRGPMFYTW